MRATRRLVQVQVQLRRVSCCDIRVWEGRTGASEPRDAGVAQEHAAREVQGAQARQGAQRADHRQAPRQAQARGQRERGESGQGRQVVHQRRAHPLARQVLANTNLQSNQHS